MCIDLGDRRLFVHKTDRPLAFMQILKETLLTNQRALLRTHPAAATGLKFHIPRFVPMFLGVTFENCRVAQKQTWDPPLFAMGKVLKLTKVSQIINWEKIKWVLAQRFYQRT